MLVEHTIVSDEINHFLYKLNHKGQLKVKLADFYFCALSTNGLRCLWLHLICSLLYLKNKFGVT